MFFEIKAGNVKPSKSSLDAMKPAGGICEGVLVKD